MSEVIEVIKSKDLHGKIKAVELQKTQMGDLEYLVKQTNLQSRIEGGELQIIKIGSLEFLTTIRGVPFLEGCKKQAEMKEAWIAERNKNFTKSGKPRKNPLPG